MIIIKVNGGLGNQLQQYALYEKLKSMGKEVKLDISWFEQEHNLAVKRDFELSRFQNVDYELCSEEELFHVLGKEGLVKKIKKKLIPSTKTLYVETKMYDNQIFEFESKVLEGYWACEKYYADIMPMLQKKLIFPISTNSYNVETTKKMQRENSISIHIRRGDYLNPENKEMFGGICTEEYYDTAIAYICQHTTNPHFYIFSDDSEYAKAHYIGNKYSIVDWNRRDDSIFDMYLMSQCKHNICANSTFSFWGARLNTHSDKIMIRPLKQKNTMQYEPEIIKQLWNGWIMIDGKHIIQ